MVNVAILGVYKDGPESTQVEVVRGKWSAWRIPSSAPRKLWKDAEGALNAVIRSRGFVNLYVYYGENLPVEYVLKIDQIEVYNCPSPAPGPAFDPSQRAYVWIRYAGIERLEQALSRDNFRELELSGGQFAEDSRPIGESGWANMHHSGLVFVEDPLTQSH
ncbi:MAG: hypothetical protein ACHRXM_19470 [Isosphaerales bacterium]